MKKILIYNSGGGLGDSIQIIPLILSLKNHFLNCNLYYLGAHENHFSGKLKEFNIKLDTLEMNLNFFGFRLWHFFFVKKNFLHNRIEKIDLIIDLQSKLRNSLILKQIPHSLFYSTTLNFNLCTIKKNYNQKDHIKNIELLLDTRIEKKEYDLTNISNELINEAKKLLPKKNYIGFSLTQGNSYRKKSWALDNFIKLAKEIIKREKIPVFFINDNYRLIEEIKSQIPGALFPEQKSNFKCPALVTALATRLECAVTIDNGVMHMMSLAKIPMIILFGPTNSNKFAPKYNSIKILDSKILYNSNNINLITVKDVLDLI